VSAPVTPEQLAEIRERITNRLRDRGDWNLDSDERGACAGTGHDGGAIALGRGDPAVASALCTCDVCRGAVLR